MDAATTPDAKLAAVRPGVILFGLLAISAVILAIWFAYESFLMKTGRRPITWYTRRLVNEHQTIALVVVFAFVFVAGVAVAHFYLDSPCQPPGI